MENTEKEFLALIKANLPDQPNKLNLAKSLAKEFTEFSGDQISHEDWFKQEVPYITKYGMTAFEYGYTNRQR